MNNKKWMEDITEFALSSNWLNKFSGYCDNPYHFQRHHVYGREAKRKVNLVSANVGHIAILPIPFELHDVSSNNRLNATHFKKRFESVFGTQKELFIDLCQEMEKAGFVLPFDKEVLKYL